MRALGVIVGVALAGVVAGCILVTGGTDGYSGSEAVGGCQAAKDCPGAACCYTIDGGLPGTSCQATCEPAATLCSVGSDCGEGGVCVPQVCTYQGLAFEVLTCGAIPVFCTQ
jgi:hypothetical protein